MASPLLRTASRLLGGASLRSWLPSSAVPGIGGVGASAALSSTTPPPPPAPPSSSDLNALLYRARQRGFLELDILLGRWAEQHAAGLDAPGRAALADLLRAENPDLFAWLTGQASPPPEVAANPVFTSIAGGVTARLAASAAPRAAPGVAWKKGWDDKGMPMDGK